jgi:hypothetical protein
VVHPVKGTDFGIFRVQDPFIELSDVTRLLFFRVQVRLLKPGADIVLIAADQPDTLILQQRKDCLKLSLPKQFGELVKIPVPDQEKGVFRVQEISAVTFPAPLLFSDLQEGGEWRGGIGIQPDILQQGPGKLHVAATEEGGGGREVLLPLQGEALQGSRQHIIEQERVIVGDEILIEKELHSSGGASLGGILMTLDHEQPIGSRPRPMVLTEREPVLNVLGRHTLDPNDAVPEYAVLHHILLNRKPGGPPVAVFDFGVSVAVQEEGGNVDIPLGVVRAIGLAVDIVHQKVRVAFPQDAFH